VADVYPDTPAGRDRWILSRRGPRAAPDARRAAAAFVEPERSEAGEVVPVATVFLVNRECPWRCLMCDLWRHTLEEAVPPGALPAQLEGALAGLPPARQIKLYNSGSFFDARAVPPADHPAIAARVAGFERVIVECHPSLVGEAVPRFRDRLAGRLEVAMGLETAHPQALEKLNKRMTLDLFARAAEFLRREDIALRAFILVQPPFLPDPAEARVWARRSVEFALETGATVAALIPTRGGNGALEALAAAGVFRPPTLATLEAALDDGLAVAQARGRGRVFADLWDLEAFSDCAVCLPARRERLARLNLRQAWEPRPSCACLGPAPEVRP
jgi:radical SAM enzyme (TIGR01210 family)